MSITYKRHQIRDYKKENILRKIKRNIRCQDCGILISNMSDELKMKVYKKYGYRTLVIWQSELNDMKKVTNRIKKFHEVS